MGKKTRGNGEGSIFQRMKNGKKIWVAQYVLYKQPNGRNKYKTFYGETRKEVKDKLEKLIVELRTDKYVDKNKITFISIAEDIIEDGYRLNKLAAASYNRKLGTLNQIKGHYISNMEIQRIAENDIKDFLEYITEYSNSVIGKIYGLVNNTFKRAIRKNIIKYNFLDDKMEFCKPKSKHKDKKVRGFTIEEQKQFMTAIMDNNNTFKYKYQFLLSLFSGMRMRRDKCFKC